MTDPDPGATTMSDTTTAPAAGYNADAAAERRAAGAVTIDAVRYLPVKRTTAVMRDVRKIGREQDRLGRKASRLAREAELELYERQSYTDDTGASVTRLEPKPFENEDAREAAERRADELADQGDAVQEQATVLTFTMLARLLVRESDRQHPDPADLTGERAADGEDRGLDLIHAEALSSFLMGDGDGEPDPTPTTPTTTS